MKTLLGIMIGLLVSVVIAENPQREMVKVGQPGGYAGAYVPAVPVPPGVCTQWNMPVAVDYTKRFPVTPDMILYGLERK